MLSDVRFVPKAEVAVIRSAELIVQAGTKGGVGEVGVRDGLSTGRTGEAGASKHLRGHLYRRACQGPCSASIL